MERCYICSRHITELNRSTEEGLCVNCKDTVEKDNKKKTKKKTKNKTKRKRKK